MVEINYPSPSTLYVSNSYGGAEIEGRATRKGAGSMKISAYTANWEVFNVRWRTIMVPELNFPVKEVSYEIKGRTFAPFDYFVNAKRLETIGFWYLSYQEVLRHLSYGPQFMENAMWKVMKDIYAAEFDNIKDVMLKWIDVCLNGDTSLDQYAFYVKEHGSSASPFGCRYSDLSPGQIKLAHERTLMWIKQYRDFYDSKVKQGETKMVHAKFTYPGVRARPGEYTVRRIGDFEFWAHVSKWRDRKVGGIPGLSQVAFPIYKNEHHAKAEAIVNAYCQKLTGIPIIDPAVTGAQAYLDLLDQPKDKLFVYDGKTQEKQTGLLFHDQGWTYDGGHPHFEAQYAPEMYSGIWVTKPANGLAGAIHTRAEMDENGFAPTKMWLFSDNLAFDAEMPPNPYVSKEDTFCGLNPVLEAFGPPSIVTDNPAHRVQFKNDHQKQVQRVQYDMRPLMSTISNNIGVPGSCRKFIKYVIDNDIIKKGTTEEVLQDDFKDAVENNFALHEKVRDIFADNLAYVKKWFFVQDRDPNFSTDLRVI